MPKISVIIPTYNRAHIVCETIDSVLAQTYKNYEIIVVDDGSEDNTKEILKKYGEKIIYIYQKNKGLPAARNTGIKHMKGEYAAFVDSDDLFLPTKLEEQMNVFDQNPEIAVVSTMAELIDDDAHKLAGYKPQAFNSCDFKGILESNFVVMSSTIVKKNVLLAVDMFDETLKTCEDWDIWIRILAEYKLYYLEKPLLKYRISADAMSKNLLKIYEGELMMLNKFQKKYNNPEQIKLVDARLQITHYQLAQEYKKKKNFYNAAKHYMISKISYGK